VKNGDVVMVRILIEAGEDIMAPDNAGNTHLHVAVMKKHWGVALFLLGVGADFNRKNKYGRTPKDIARHLKPTNAYDPNWPAMLALMQRSKGQ